MNKSFKQELLITTAIWAFLIAGAGAFLGLKAFLSKDDPTSDTPVEISADDNVTPLETPEEPETEEPVELADSYAGEETVPSTDPGASPFAGNPGNANGTNSSTTYNAVGHVMNDGLKYIYYKTLVWGSVSADFSDFRVKVAETLNDTRGWPRAGLKFVEVSSGQDLNIILSDSTSLEGYNGYCSGSLSCTSGFNEVIINDERWRFGTTETTSGGMSTRDYQHMVINHEVGHWLGHYSHIEACDADGAVAPIMLQQSTGLRNCGSFNPWPLNSELWILR